MPAPSDYKGVTKSCNHTLRMASRILYWHCVNLVLRFQKWCHSNWQKPCLIRWRQRYLCLASTTSVHYQGRRAQGQILSFLLWMMQLQMCGGVLAWISGMDWSDCESNPYSHEVSLAHSQVKTINITPWYAWPEAWPFYKLTQSSVRGYHQVLLSASYGVLEVWTGVGLWVLDFNSSMVRSRRMMQALCVDIGGLALKIVYNHGSITE